MKETAENPLHLKSVNHISIICKSVEESIDFYTNTLGFEPIRRPGSFDFDGAWLFNYGIGIHLLQSENPNSMQKKTEINPKDNHISFQCESMGAVEKNLKEMGIVYKRQRVEEGGIYVDQLFFHDPDGFMIEICNCDNLPVIPIAEEMRFQVAIQTSDLGQLERRKIFKSPNVDLQEAEITRFDRYGQPVNVTSGWQVRILQHKCDHLEGTLFVDKMVKRTFRTLSTWNSSLAKSCPKQGGC